MALISLSSSNSKFTGRKVFLFCDIYIAYFLDIGVSAISCFPLGIILIKDPSGKTKFLIN